MRQLLIAASYDDGTYDPPKLEVTWTEVPPVVPPTFSLRSRGGDARRRLTFKPTLKL